MTTYSEWQLPLNPPNPYSTYLHSLAPVRPSDNYVYYTKYIIGVLGELDVSKTRNNVREWAFPQQLTSSTIPGIPANLVHLDRDPTSSHVLWSLLEEYHGALIHFDPRNGLFTRFTIKVQPHGSLFGGPLFMPRDLKFDRKGNLWFVVAVGRPGISVSAIACFNTQTHTVRYWEVPDMVMRNIISLRPDAHGSRIWVSSVDANVINPTKPWFGCLDVAMNNFRTYTPPRPQLNPPRSIDVVVTPDSVWLTAGKSSLVTNTNNLTPGIFRLDLNSNQIFKYVTDPNISWPRYLSLDPQNGQAWVTDASSGAIVHCEPAKSCRKVNFIVDNFQLKSGKSKLIGQEFNAKPVISSATPLRSGVKSKQYPCATEYKAAGMHAPDQIQMQVMPSRGNRLYFVCFGANKIGMLEP